MTLPPTCHGGNLGPGLDARSIHGARSDRARADLFGPATSARPALLPEERP